MDHEAGLSRDGASDTAPPLGWTRRQQSSRATGCPQAYRLASYQQTHILQDSVPKGHPLYGAHLKGPAYPRRASQTTGSRREVSPLPLPVPSMLCTHTLVHTARSSPRSLSLCNLRVYREVKAGVRQESDSFHMGEAPRRVSAETQRPDHRETIRLF